MQESVVVENAAGEVVLSELEKKYEALVIISCKSGGDSVSAMIEKLKKLVEDNAKLGSVDEWGKRKLAYPINKEPEAYYVLFNFISTSEFPAEFIRICRITDGVVRAMVTKSVVKKGKKTSAARLKKKQQASSESSESSITENSGVDDAVASPAESVNSEVEGAENA